MRMKSDIGCGAFGAAACRHQNDTVAITTDDSDDNYVQSPASNQTADEAAISFLSSRRQKNSQRALWDAPYGRRDWWCHFVILHHSSSKLNATADNIDAHLNGLVARHGARVHSHLAMKQEIAIAHFVSQLNRVY